MEEADARLQEVVASLLNEHGGNHEQALRQTFACLHNSGLYEAQSAAEEEQREQQVLAVFRSFPFRAPAPPAGNGNGNGAGGSLVEETQAPPPAYNTLSREPEEAGEVIAEQVDPENVGENGSVQPAPEALLPLNPGEPQLEIQQAAPAPPGPGPEVSHQGSAAPIPPQQQPHVGVEDSASQQQQQGAATTPESFASAGLETAAGAGVVAAVATAAATTAAPGTATAAAATVSLSERLPVEGGGIGVEETKGGEWSREVDGVEATGFPETGEAGTGRSVAEEADLGGPAQESGLHLEAGGEGVDGGGGVACSSSSEAGAAGTGAVTGSSEELETGIRGGPVSDPESTQQQESSATPVQVEPRQVNGGSASPPPATGAPVPLPATACPAGEIVPGEERNMDAPAAPADRDGGDGGAAAAAAVPATAETPPAGAAAAAAPTTTAVTEPHLKTGGQPLTHANRAQSPTGMATDLQDKLKALKLRRKHRFVTMRIEGTEVVAETVAAPGEGPAELKLALPYSDCRYAVYDQEIVTADGRKANKLFFFTWIPHNATPHNKMAYSHGKVTVRQRLEGLYDVAASSFGDVEVALGLVDEDEEDSDIDF